VFKKPSFIFGLQKQALVAVKLTQS